MFLFGKVPLPSAGPAKDGGAPRDGGFVSACACVENLQRCIFAVPPADSTLFADTDGQIAALEQRVAAGEADAKLELMRLLQQRAGPLKLEIREALVARGVTKFTMRPVKRSYAFEREDVARSQQYVLKARVQPAQRAMAPRRRRAAPRRASEHCIRAQRSLRVRDCFSMLHFAALAVQEPSAENQSLPRR